MAVTEGGDICPCSGGRDGLVLQPCCEVPGVFIFPSSVAWGNTELRLLGGGEQAVCCRHGASIKRPMSGFPSSFSPFQKGTPPFSRGFISISIHCALHPSRPFLPGIWGYSEEGQVRKPTQTCREVSEGGTGARMSLLQFSVQSSWLQLPPLHLLRSSWCICLRLNFHSRVLVLSGEGESDIWLHSVIFLPRSS